VSDKKSLFEFFDKTFYAFQYEDLVKLHSVLERIIGLLNEWELIKISGRKDFVSADSLNEEKYETTIIGKRVSELYLDPYTANFIMICLRKATSKKTTMFSFLQMLSSTLEIRPLLRVKVSEYENVQNKLLEFKDYLLSKEPSEFDDSYDAFLNSVKTSFFFNDWIEETNEEVLLEEYNIRPGETRAKLAIADWLLYSSQELARMLSFQPLIKNLSKLRFRLKYGVKEELLQLLKLKKIGRVRARKMFSNKLKTLTDVKKADITTLAQLIGKATAVSVKKQLGQDFDPKKIVVKEKKRKGQKSLKDYGKKK
jgi:helicase